MGKKRNKKRNLKTCYVEVEKDLGMWQDYMQYGPQYDTNNDCPINPGESDMVEQLSFKKLSVDTRKQLRATMVNWVLDYWQTERLIPEGAIIKEFRNAAIKEVYYICGQYVKGKPPVIHVFSATLSISIFVPQNEAYDDTRRSCRNYYVLQGTQSNL